MSFLLTVTFRACFKFRVSLDVYVISLFPSAPIKKAVCIVLVALIMAAHNKLLTLIDK